MFQSIGDITAVQQGRGRRTHQPIHRHSRPAGHCEGVFWRSTSRREVQQIVLAARRYELATRQPGARSGALGFVALEVLELFANLVNFRNGRLDPSLDFLMAKLKRSRDAIVRALAALRTHGFLDWLRRFEPTGNEGSGPQVRQVSNAYRLFLPRRAAAMLGRFFKIPPAPDDHSHAQEIRTGEYEAYRAALSELERTVMDVDPDDPLGAALLRFAQARAHRAERESAKQTESRSSSIS
ncbi:helix-turn-helix domain-containing protein [Chelatococcus sp. YT9]|uniref:helix-turn-helix domain-containing protein n=1 Tax=Chelatococcus sp. YT9 TaxID=2835635 RepID=UPI001BD007B2|nr:helix-turn-helix domain-containing protein [Chelatococcus sp. YT9]MBS7701671.1 helix-turn-helix domain-containing protein [Chelatococcus sp. YT9]